MEIKTPEDAAKLSYTDFVGFVNQWNVLPGAHTTLSKWALYSKLSQESTLLELACTSGFSSRELALYTGCLARGIDISETSVASAVFNAKTYAPQAQLSYEVANAYTYTPPAKSSHVAIGAALKFFPDANALVRRVIETFLEDTGYFLASPFYITTPIPESLVQKARSVFGITITTESYKEIMQPYRGLEIIYQDHQDLIPETEEELAHYCESTITRATKLRNITDNSVQQALYDRLLTIKRMSNDLRPYQRYTTLVLRYRSNVYPGRYVELF